jgi:CxxC motif-containing protein
MEEKIIICTRCPKGCRIKIQAKDGNIISIKGNSCIKGIEYAKDEFTNPKRILTTTVKVIDGEFPLVSVKTEKAIPKEMLLQGMKEISSIKVKAPIRIGEIIKENFIGIGVKIIATRNVIKKIPN